MNENIGKIDLYAKLARYSLMLSCLALMSILMLFPSGMYYGFVCAALGVAGGILTRPYLKRKSACTAAVVIGVITILLCFVAFHGMYSLYIMIKDPVAGPQISSVISQILNQYGVPIETFAQIIRP